MELQDAKDSVLAQQTRSWYRLSEIQIIQIHCGKSFQHLATNLVTSCKCKSRNALWVCRTEPQLSKVPTEGTQLFWVFPSPPHTFLGPFIHSKKITQHDDQAIKIGMASLPKIFKVKSGILGNAKRLTGSRVSWHFLGRALLASCNFKMIQRPQSDTQKCRFKIPAATGNPQIFSSM